MTETITKQDLVTYDAPITLISHFDGQYRSSKQSSGHSHTAIASILATQEGETVCFRARVTTSWTQGTTVVILVLRQRTHSIQALVTAGPQGVTKQTVQWASSIPKESIVVVEGIIQTLKEEVNYATAANFRILINQIHLVAPSEENLHFSFEDASRRGGAEEDAHFSKVSLDLRLNNRVLDLRTQTNQAVFALKSAATWFFGSFLRSRDFIEIHSPKLQYATVETDDSDFKVGYFKYDAYLAQSPQFSKQMCIAADFERIFEIGPVFRAGNENTHRHMTEFIALDLEMTFEYHYHEVVDLIDQMLLNFFRQLKENHAREIELVRTQFPAEEFKWREGPEGTLKLTYKDAGNLLAEDGVDRAEMDDISIEDEQRLGKIIKKKYDTDYYIVEKFPSKLRPFYSMPDPDDPTLTNSYDFFMRGEEILSGAQRINEPKMLIEKMQARGIDPSSIQGYIDAFKLGCAPHAGCGIGLERVIMLFLKLDNIRRVSAFPRDPTRLKP